MAVVFVRSGLLLALRCLVNQQPPDDLLLRLYTNPVTPQDEDSAERYEEPKGYGYKAILLRGAQWRFHDKPIRASYPRQAFRLSGPVGDLYGYFVTQAKSGELVWAELFEDGPHHCREAGGAIGISLEIMSAQPG